MNNSFAGMDALLIQKSDCVGFASQALTYWDVFRQSSHRNQFGTFSFKAPTNRHPERSASQIYRVNSVWGAKSKDPDDAYLVDAVRSFSTTQVREQDSPCGTHLMVTNTSFRTIVWPFFLVLDAGERPWRLRQVRVSVAERCKQHRRDKHPRGPSTPRPKRCSRDKSVKRFAQDDDFAGVLKKNQFPLDLLRPARPVGPTLVAAVVRAEMRHRHTREHL
jgi:hypothetical protein